MNTHDSGSALLRRTGCRREISAATQAFLQRGAFLFAGLLLVFLVPRGIAQSPREPSANPQDMFLSLDGSPAMGDEKAIVTIVEFGDYQCPYCAQHANQVLPQIITNYVNTGKVRYFFRDTPVEAIHPQAFKAAVAALCAGEQGKYWEMHDRLFKNQEALAGNELAAHAGALDLDVPKFQRCLDNDTYAVQIRKSIQDAVKSGVRGTPTFFVGILNPEESGEKTVRTLSGFKPYSAFQQTLDQMLSPGGAESKRQ